VIVAWPLAVRAQRAGKVWRIGVLLVEPAAAKPDTAPIWNAFIEGLRAHGYVEGENLVIEYRLSEGRSERWPELARELVRLKVDLILVGTTPSALAAKNATSSIPIVHAGAIDPVGAGLAASLARPGETGGKCDWARNLFPAVGRKGSASAWKETENAARASGLTLHSVPIRDLKEFDNLPGAVAEG